MDSPTFSLVFHPSSTENAKTTSEKSLISPSKGKSHSNRKSPIFLTAMGKDKLIGQDKGPKTRTVILACQANLPPEKAEVSSEVSPAEASGHRNQSSPMFLKATGKQKELNARGALQADISKKEKFHKPTMSEESVPSPGVMNTESERSIEALGTDNLFWRKKICQAFKMIDLNQDGFITLSDFEDCAQRYKEKMKMATNEQILRCKIMLEVESRSLGLVDNSTLLSLDGYIGKWMERARSGFYGIKHFEEIFRVIDLDAEGYIYYYQLYLFYRTMAYDVNVEDISNIFDAMDRDRDKIVSMSDFVFYHREYFYTTENSLNSSILYGPLPKEH